MARIFVFISVLATFFLGTMVYGAGQEKATQPVKTNTYNTHGRMIGYTETISDSSSPDKTTHTTHRMKYNSLGRISQDVMYDHETGEQTDISGLKDALESFGNSDQEKLLEWFKQLNDRASDGDMGALAEFMMFIAELVSKDKAEQNVEMGKKLMELQESSRKAMEELMGTPEEDDEDSEFTKMLEKVRGEESSIATSQKLIAQMMEEMAQITETLNNATKSALDANGRLMRNLSRMDSGSSEDDNDEAESDNDEDDDSDDDDKKDDPDKDEKEPKKPLKEKMEISERRREKASKAKMKAREVRDKRSDERRRRTWSAGTARNMSTTR